jgi:predicted oxidoreductase (fatty acid repression mutant protein)
MRPHKGFGVNFEESEITSSINQFIEDVSGSLRYLGDALRHYNKMIDKLVRKMNVEDLSNPDTEMIPEYQTAEDNVL